MNGPAFLLAVNFVIAICFSLVFVVVSTRSRSRTAALWFAAGFAVASLSSLCELLVAYTELTRFWAFGAFAAVLGGLLLLLIGVGELYGRKIKFAYACVFLAASTVLDMWIYDLPRGTVAHAFSYQAPFAIVVLTGAASVFLSTRRLIIDRALGALLLVTGLHFFAKAGLAVLSGAGTTAKDYIHTNYALISQSSTAVLVVAVGLTLLSVLVLEIMADERSNSERDALSGLPNRRGFENGLKAAMAHAANARHAVIICDLDYFKNINDTHGHHGGDLVIRAFGDLLQLMAPKSAVLGRIGGEEFAVFMPNTTAEMALLLANALRSGTMGIQIGALSPSFRVTASFGVAEVEQGQEFVDAMRNADDALYEAKRSGRNCVRQATPSALPRSAPIKIVK